VMDENHPTCVFIVCHIRVQKQRQDFVVGGAVHGGKCKGKWGKVVPKLSTPTDCGREYNVLIPSYLMTVYRKKFEPGFFVKEGTWGSGGWKFRSGIQGQSP
jgi:hypothetical protein